MRLHILGICGTFMAGLAEIATQMGYQVTGSDANVYPPMSTFLCDRGITLHEGYEAEQFAAKPDLVLIGNALSRGNPAVEYVLNESIPYTSGAQWLADTVLKGRHVIAVAGTHGKTSTTSLLAWILHCAGFDPGYLIGGIAPNFARPANLGSGEFFVIEADEYDTAFFDKRSKFVHYRPRGLVINNLEFDHADIFPDLDAIKTQFHHLMRTVPSNGAVWYQAGDAAITDMLAQGCWSRRISFGFDGAADWQIVDFNEDREEKFRLSQSGTAAVGIRSKLLGRHNALNVTAAVAVAYELGVDFAASNAALRTFEGIKRRLEIIGVHNEVTVYDDFAHHPTAIAATIDALRGAVGNQRIVCVFEPRSNTMRQGSHASQLAAAFGDAEQLYVFTDGSLQWDPAVAFEALGTRCKCFDNTQELVAELGIEVRRNDHIVVMSNGAFGGIHGDIMDALKRKDFNDA